MSKRPKMNLQLFGEKPKPPRYFSMAVEGEEADIYIFGDIVSWPWLESDVSSYSLAKAIAALADVSVINVHINSYGGEVAEGLAIYNSLKNHPAKIKTVCDGFACSAASVVFMAGEDRIMNAASLLMIHNAWCYAAGNADQLRKAADDLETISNAAAEAYKGSVSITDDELDVLLDNETWIAPEDALKWGFATEIKKAAQSAKAAASAMGAIIRAVMATPIREGLLESAAVELRITDLDELKALSADVAAIRAAIPSLAGGTPQAGGKDVPQAGEPNPKATPIDFLAALMGGKD